MKLLHKKIKKNRTRTPPRLNFMYCGEKHYSSGVVISESGVRIPFTESRYYREVMDEVTSLRHRGG